MVAAESHVCFFSYRTQSPARQASLPTSRQHRFACTRLALSFRSEPVCSFSHHVRTHLFLPYSLPFPCLTLAILTMMQRLFERGAESCGQDFLAHPFWDKYIEFEERLDDSAQIFHILDRVIKLPLHQYSRYFERYSSMSKQQPIESLASPEVISQLRNEVEQTTANPADVERELRARVDAINWETFNRTQAEVTKRWTFEQGIKRPYYHVTDLDEEQQANWEKYLDSEEAEGDYARTKFLYERCLVTAANYEHLWFRYIRWLSAQKGKDEEIRNAYQRASFIFIPIAQPSIRLHWAKFEESKDRADVAIDIHEAILSHVPSDLPTIISMVNVHRRQYGVDAAVEVLKKYTESAECTVQTRGALVAEWARILWRSKADVEGARKLFATTQNQFLDCQPFWSNWLSFEIEQSASEKDEEARHERIKSVHEAIRQKSTLPTPLVKELSGQYSLYLEQRGGKDAVKELLDLDVRINGPASVANAKLANGGKSGAR